MNEYLFLEEEAGGFFANLVLKIDALNIFEIAKGKIDTGCAKTNIPIKRLNFSDKQAKALKQQAIADNIPHNSTYGVSDTIYTRRSDKDLISKGNLIDVSALRFSYFADSLTIGDQWIGGCDVGVNFDRTGNILIGLDTLRNFQIVIDTSLKTGKYTLIGCLKSQSDKSSYHKAVLDHFGICC